VVGNNKKTRKRDRTQRIARPAYA